MFQEATKASSDDEQGKIDLIPVFRSYIRTMEWEDQPLYKPAGDVFIQEFEIARLAIEITFSIRPKFKSKNFLITTILSSFGAATSNVSEAQLTLSRFFRKDVGLSQLRT